MCRKMICLVSFVLVSALILTNFAQAELIGYWKFDESSGTIAADSAGGDNDGILFGDQLEWTAGRFGGALSHGGSWDAGVEFPTTGMSATAGTVAMWGVLADPQPAQNKYFFGHTTQPQWSNRIQLYMNDGDNLLDLGLGNSHTVDTDIMELPMEEWVHVALTWDSDNYVVYVNGENVSTGTYAGLSEIHPIANIGNNGTSGPDKGFAGLLDEVRLYDHALTADEVRTAMNGAASLQAWGPSPNDGTSHPETWVVLSWNPGVYAVSHDVYFGDNFDDVNTGTGSTFRGNQISNHFFVGLPGDPYPDGLAAETTYYWRIDEVDADGVTTHKGKVWSFFIASDEPSAVSTFHCIGIYWSPQDGSSDNVCQVLYRSFDSTEWKEALPLWYDDRGVGGNGDSDFPYPPQYRGSIVNLEPGTTYEIELSLLNTGISQTFTASTWSEEFPIAKTVYLEVGTTNQALSITESGSPDGYILYTHPEGETSTINVNNQEDSCIYISASYIIIRGLTLREASIHGIRILHNVHDVVIEECDISGWGRLQEGEWG
ncbi:MAG: LamG domain-containing protein, partial [Planctomycetes bacterium]|nr:LamG domain-containing protein [Planctomycetota bacterium]